MSQVKLGFFFLLVIWAAWLFWLWLEAYQHEKNLGRISIRIHVNGTRGKSGVTRLIAAGLRGGGMQVLAKVTGTDAKIIEPDGTERMLSRRGPANIREYLKTVSAATACGADALVTECMALRPELQHFCEHRLMKSNIGIITNIRHDHEEIMGPQLSDIAHSLARTIPAAGKLVTTAEAFALLRANACLGDTEVILANPEGLTTEELAGFPFEVERDNLALALAVCELAGVNRAAALLEMMRSQPDRGNLTVSEVLVAGRRIRVVNAMAANDPDSTRILWVRYVVGQGNVAGILLHSRMDRRLRTRELARCFAKFWLGPYFLTGDTAFAAKCLMQNGVADHQIVSLASPDQSLVLLSVATAMQRADGILFAAGNMKGFVA